MSGPLVQVPLCYAPPRHGPRGRGCDAVVSTNTIEPNSGSFRPDSVLMCVKTGEPLDTLLELLPKWFTGGEPGGRSDRRNLARIRLLARPARASLQNRTGSLTADDP